MTPNRTASTPAVEKAQRRTKRDEWSCPCCGTPNDGSYCAPCVAAECGERDYDDPHIETCLVTAVIRGIVEARQRLAAAVKADDVAFKAYGERYDAVKKDNGESGALLDNTKAEWDAYQRTRNEVYSAARYLVVMGGAS